MRPHFPALSLLFLTACIGGLANAQSSNGYAIGGVGSYNSKLITQAALGGEMVFGKGFGAGGELGFVGGHTSFGFLSANGYYHFLPHGSSQKLDPFVTGGYTYAFDPLAGLTGSTVGANGVNFGLGLHYWFLHHLGVRAEFRDLLLHGTASTPNFWGFRAGLAIR
jgi:hypothetical protein